MVPAHVLFYPAAAIYAAIAVHAYPATHAPEMLFGFVLAAVAGNQLGPVPRWKLALLFGAWLAARAAFALAPSAYALANAPFAILLAWQLAPRLVAPIRKWRNRALPLAVLALCIAAVAADVRAALFILALLMLFMGGRILAPYAAVRVQPRFEAALIVLLALAAALPAFAGPLALGAALVAAVRLARWRLWRLRGRPDVACLAAGYAWVVLGLAAVGAALLAGARPATAIHVLTVGAMGTLTVNVMALTYARLARVDPARELLPVWATGLVAAATVARVAGWLTAAALLWSAAYVLLLVAFARISRAGASRRRA